MTPTTPDKSPIALNPLNPRPAPAGLFLDFLFRLCYNKDIAAIWLLGKAPHLYIDRLEKQIYWEGIKMFSPIVSLIAGIFFTVGGIATLVSSCFHYPCEEHKKSEHLRTFYGVLLALYVIATGAKEIKAYVSTTQSTPSTTSAASTEGLTLASLENLRNLGLTEEEVKNVWFNCHGDKATIFVANGTLYYASRGTLRVIPILVNYDD